MFPWGFEIAKPEVLLVACGYVVFENCAGTVSAIGVSSCDPPTFIKRVTVSLKGIMEMSPAVLSEQSDPVETVS